MHSAPAASGTGSQRQAKRRLAGGLLLSLLFHGLVLSLQFGIPTIAPGLTRPLTVSIAVPEPWPLPAPDVAPLPAPASAVAPTPGQPHSGAPGTGVTLVDPVPPSVAAVAKPPASRARRVRTRRAGMPSPLPHTDQAQVRVITQDSNPDASFKVPLPQPGGATPLAPARLQAQDGGDQGAGDASAGMTGEPESPEVADEAALLLAQRLAEEKSQADQAARRAAADLERQRQEAEASLALQQRVAEDQARVVAEHKAAEDQREYLAQQRLATEAEDRARVQARQVADEQASEQAQRVAGEQARAEAQRVAAEREEMQRRAGEIAAALAARKLAEEDERQQALVGERLELAARQQAKELARTRQAALEAARRQDEEMALRQREEQRVRQEAGQLAARQQADELARQQAGQIAALRQADAEAARRQAQEAAHRQLAEQLARQLAEQAAARAQAEEAAQQLADQAAARAQAEEVERQLAEQAAARAQAEEAERQLADQAAARVKAAEAERQLAEQAAARAQAAEAERQQALPPAPQLAQRSGPEPDSGIPGMGTGNAASTPGAGRVTIPKNMLGSDLANRARDMVRGIDILRGIPPAVRPAEDELRARRRAVVDAVERDVPLRMYVDSFRQKIERNAAIIAHRLAPGQVRRDPLVSVALRSDGSVEDVTIVRSSGRAETDEAVRHIVRINARYSAFPPNVAARYDVVEIRRIWTFAEGLKLLEEVR